MKYLQYALFKKQQLIEVLVEPKKERKLILKLQEWHKNYS